jgi:hypothetical protein
MNKIKILLLIPFYFLQQSLHAQQFPEEMKLSDDGRRLTLGGNQTTGFYDDTQVKIIELEFDQSNYWNLLDEDTPAKLTYEGETYEGVGVRFKGATSDFMNDSQKKSFNISIDYTDENLDIDGYQTTNLNGGFQDPSNLREILFNWIGRHYNPSLKTNFVHLKINGQNWGAYTNVQQLNNDYIREWFMNDAGSRFRCTDPNWEPGQGPPPPPPPGPCGGGMGGPGNPGGWGGGPSSLNWLGSDSTLYQNYYDLKGSDRDDPWGELITSIDKLNNLPVDQLADSLGQYFDIDKTLWYLAHELMLTDEDGYIYKGRMDYYVYFDDALEVLIPLEYDGNSTMEMNLINWSPFKRSNDPCFPLMNKIMQVPEFRQRYLAHCRTIINEYMDLDLIHEKIDFYADLINDLEADDPVGDQLFSYDQFLEGVEELKAFFVQRRNFLLNHGAINRVPLDISAVSYFTNGEEYQAPSASEEVSVNATIGGGNIESVHLYYGEGLMGAFQKVEMFDDGQHNDGEANDGVFGAKIPTFAAGSYVRYYVEAIKADNSGTRSYEPVGAEHDVFIYRVLFDPSTNETVVINEIQASNTETVSDQDGEFDDWIELYNNSSTTIDLSGYYLSDNFENLSKWEIPENTSIDADSYLIIWADEDGSQEGLHANFKLSKDGEELFLSNADGELVDQLIFGTQETDLAYARAPNGTGEFVIKEATFNANNDNVVGLEQIQADVFELKLYPNPTMHSFQLEFKSLDKSPKLVRVYNSIGVCISEKPIEQSGHFDCSNWPRGIYHVKVGTTVRSLIIQ